MKGQRLTVQLGAGRDAVHVGANYHTARLEGDGQKVIMDFLQIDVRHLLMRSCQGGIWWWVCRLQPRGVAIS